MATFIATMRVIHIETWEVEAADEVEAREKFRKLTEDVIADDSGGEIADWGIQSIEQIV